MCRSSDAMLFPLLILPCATRDRFGLGENILRFFIPRIRNAGFPLFPAFLYFCQPLLVAFLFPRLFFDSI